MIAIRKQSSKKVNSSKTRSENERRQMDYNEFRPHSAAKCLTSAEFARKADIGAE